MNVKQVIVVRKDLNMRRGKEDAQSAHAAMGWLLNHVKELPFEPTSPEDAPGFYQVGNLGLFFTTAEMEWMAGLTKKVTVQVESEAELEQVAAAAAAAGLYVHMVVDAGLTEFGGVHTKTCLAIGPDEAEKIDPITQHLKLR